MEYRSFGSTGLKVSPLCLGAMMFGSWGNRDHGECIRIIHRALEAGAWVLRHPAVHCAIIGPRTLAQLEDSLGALDVAITPEEAARIDELVPPGTSAL
jgi:aryl-alcohol dehydrogenase-like predicted oxidoreductase